MGHYVIARPGKDPQYHGHENGGTHTVLKRKSDKLESTSGLIRPMPRVRYFVDAGYIITYVSGRISITNLGIQIVRANPEHVSLTIPSQYTDHIS